MGRKFGFSFSAKRALGISGLMGKIARATGIPTTRSGLYRKVGRMVTGSLFSSGGGHKSSRKTFGVSFSLNRALGLSGAKGSFARATGIPTTASGLERKIGRMVVGGLVGGATAGQQAQPLAAPTMQPQPVETGILCSMCGLALFPDELICPRCAAAAPGADEHEEPRLVWVDAQALRPIEHALWNMAGEKVSDAAMLKRLADAQLPMDEHPLVGLVRHWAELKCDHVTHNTPEKREACLNRQAGEIALHTLRHYIAMLVGLSRAAPAAAVQYAAWIGDDATENCPFCRQREGIAIPASTRRLPIIDPFCDCNLFIMHSGREDYFLASIAASYQQTDPERASIIQRNASCTRRSGRTSMGT